VALVLGAAAFDSPSLYLPGVALVFLGSAAAAWVWLAVKDAGVARVPGPATVEEERPYEVLIDVHVPVGALAGELAEPLLGRPVPVRRLRRRVRIDVRFARRGRRELDPARLVIRDPLGLAERTLETEPAEVLVLPRLEPVVAEGGGQQGSGESGSLTAAVAELELDTLRPYRPGAPASRIHWPTSARTGEMMERHLVSDADSKPLVVLDPRGAADEAALDDAVRATASLAVHLAREGGCALLLPGDRRPTVLEPTLASWEHAHARLAVVTGVRGPNLAGLANRRGPVFYVAASAPQRPPRALTHAPGGGRVLVVPGTMAGRRAIFTVAGCAAYELSGQRAAAEVA
jgi:uncharacterized protein (DUF58 family)